MIKPKFKICSVCGKSCILWRSNPKQCKECVQKEKVATTPRKYATKEIKKVSTRMQKLNAAYKILRDQFMKSHPHCEARLPGCTNKATECHHVRGRGQYYLDDTTYLATCNSCHKWINEHNEAAFEMGFCKSRLENLNQ